MTPFLSDISVNGETISAERIAAEAQNHPAPKSKPGQAWMAAARALAVRTLLLQEARRRGLVPDPQEIAEGQFETGDEALVRQVLDEALDPLSPTESELHAAYESMPDRWRGPTLYEAAHILLPVRPDDTRGLLEAQSQAEAILAELRRSPRAFDALAREHSACSSRDAGGRLGQLVSGDTVPEFEAAMDAMDEGSTSKTPVLSRYGLHIIRLDARAKGAVLPLEAVAPRIHEMLEKAAWGAAARDFVVGLAAGSEVKGISLEAA